MHRIFSTNKKIIIIITLCVVMLSFSIYLVSVNILLKSFNTIEEDHTIQNVDRTKDAITNAVDQLGVKLTDWAWWDDTYSFMSTKDHAYIESNLGTASIANLKINAMLFVSLSGDIVFEKRVDFKNKKDVASSTLGEYIREHHVLDNFTIESKQKGIIMLPEGPMLITALPILTSEGKGPIKGVLLFGKFLDADLIKNIGELTHVVMNVYPYDSSILPTDVVAFKNTQLNDELKIATVPISNTIIAGYTFLNDIYKKPILIIKIESHRDIYNQGQKTLYSFIGIAAGFILFFGLIIIVFIEGIFVIRFTKLSNEVKYIGDTKDFNKRVTVGKNDEIGILAFTINQTLEILSIARHAEAKANAEALNAEENLDKRLKELEQANTLLTERGIKVNALMDELEKFKLVIDNTSQHIIITDIDGIIIYANPAVEKITGYAHNEVIGQKPSLWGKQMPPEFYETMWKTIKEQKKTFSGEIKNRRKNGELYIAKSVISPVLDENGNIKFFVALESDISKEKALEQGILDEKKKVEEMVVIRTKELHAEKARLHAAINSLSFGFIILDTDNTVILQNKAMTKLFDLKKNSVVTIDTISSLLGEHINLKMHVDQCFNSKALCEIKEIVFGKKILRGIIAPVLTEDGDGTIGYVFLLEDVTEARILERSRDEFFSIASHELRTPLTAIRGNSQMLLDDYKDKMADSDMTEMIDDIHVSSVRLIDIVNDFLEVSRLEQGRIQIKKEEFDISALVSKVIKDVGMIAKTKNIAIASEPKSGSPILVSTDKARVEQVLFNLLGNAIKFTNTGTVTIQIKPIKGFVKISVIDTGIGISEQNQLLLFKKFQQAGDVLARDMTQGTGLGLYICHLIISKLGGTIDLEKSAQGEGSIFTFTVPTNS